jgi:hypothetical protein
MMNYHNQLHKPKSKLIPFLHGFGVTIGMILLIFLVIDYINIKVELHDAEVEIQQMLLECDYRFTN